MLLLDEPASGLDPAGRVEFRELIKQLHEMGRTIVISSHILTEMTEFCTSIGILEQGRLVASGKVNDILARLEPELHLVIEVQGELDQLKTLLTHDPAAENIIVNTSQLKCIWRGPRETLPALHRTIVESGIPLVSFAVAGDNLEEIYMRISHHSTS